MKWKTGVCENLCRNKGQTTTTAGIQLPHFMEEELNPKKGTGMADSLLRKKEQKDEELDRRIVALRRKNQALLRRYQEIEEDRRQAEKEGMAVTAPRPPRADGLTITITKAHSEKRVVSDRRASSHPNSLGPGVNNEEELGEEEEEEDEEEEDDHTFTFRLGKRVQLAVTMENKVKGKRIVSTKAGSQRDEGTLRGGSSLGSPMQIAITMEPGQKAVGPGSQELGRDYVRWKQEREQIDLARLARHRDAQGEWRRPWDLDKSKHMFQDASKTRDLVMPGGSSKKGPRNYPKFQSRPLPPDERGSGAHSGNLGKSKVPAMSSKARGKDRLTGRARRWDTKEEEEQCYPKEEPESQGSHNTKRSQNEEEAKKVEHSDQCGIQEPSAGLPSLDGHQREREAKPSTRPTASSSELRSSRKIAPVLPFFSPGDANSSVVRASWSSKPGEGPSMEESSLFSFPNPSEKAQKLSDNMAELCLGESAEQEMKFQEPREEGSGQAGIQGNLGTLRQPSQKSQPRARSDKKSGEQD
ncbi:coiled-coil domain-containing protein 9B isoform X2 [Sminthopsis crassicaudata]|uniref:coiled-coil domain-containing protein 9B isoform X2 n=1 Tax=Sminthopsis crassicaudata TaxID=9301 RepID=UPI003D69F5AC